MQNELDKKEKIIEELINDVNPMSFINFLRKLEQAVPVVLEMEVP